MNWITKIIKAGEKIKTAIHKRASKEEIAKSDWTSCCKGPILKKDLEENLWVCPDCKRHHRIKPHQRFDILFGKNNYEIFKTPIPKDDPLNWTDSKPYKERLKSARKKTGLECGMMVASGTINNIKITAVASDFDFLGASMAAAEGEAFLYEPERFTPSVRLSLLSRVITVTVLLPESFRGGCSFGAIFFIVSSVTLIFF